MDRELLMNGLAHGAFFLGMFLVVVSSFVQNSLLQVSLIVLGLIVGFLNIQVDEVVRFLLALLAVIATTSILKVAVADLQLPVAIANATLAFLESLILFMSPAALVVGIGTLVDVVRD